jgi:hypothetical protein
MVWEDFVKLNTSMRYENEMFENRLWVYDNRVLRGMSEPDSREAAGKWVQLYSEKLSVCSFHQYY